jgi:imidazoleglycerol phosphate dehydratase HisB
MAMSEATGEPRSVRPERSARLERNTKETRIAVAVELDRRGTVRIDTPVPFFSHMLEAWHSTAASTCRCMLAATWR